MTDVILNPWVFEASSDVIHSLKFDIDKVLNYTAGNERPLLTLFYASENDDFLLRFMH